MKARLGWLVAVVGAGAVALSAAAQGSAKLAVGPEAGGYLCPDGRQLYVKSCYDNSANANCGVVLMHLPAQNGFQRESTEMRSKLTPSVAACKVYPLEFRNDGTVGLVVPKSSPTQQTTKASAATPTPKTSPATPSQNTGDILDLTVADGMAFGYTNVRSSLVRISTPGANQSVLYIDVASRKPTGQKDVVAIWLLQVWPNGNPSVPSVSAMWTEFNANCKESSYEQTIGILLDRQAKVLSLDAMNETRTSTKNKTVETPLNIACQTFTPSKEPRFASAKAAIADAIAGAAPKTVAKATPPTAKPAVVAKPTMAPIRLPETETEKAFFQAIKSNKFQTAINAVVRSPGGKLATLAQLTDNQGMTALHWAAANRNAAMTRWLVDKGVKVDLADERGRTPLKIALDNKDKQVMTVLLNRGAYAERAWPGHDDELKGITKTDELVEFMIKNAGPAAIADVAAPKTAAKPVTPAAQPNAAEQAQLAFLEGERLLDEVGGDVNAVRLRKEAALAAYAKATKLDPTLRAAWLRQGEIYGYDTETLDAIPFYEKAMELDPNDVETAEVICEQYVFASISSAKGIAACERFLKLNPFDPTFAHSAIAGLQQERGDNPKALVSALEWARLAPDDSYAWQTLSEIYAALGRNTDALAAVQKAVNLNSRDWSILAQRGDVYRRLGKFNESIADYKASIIVWPEGPQLHHGLADSLRAAGRKAEADAEKRLAIDHALSNGRNALKKPADGSPASLRSIVSAKAFLGMLEKWDRSAAAKLAADIKAAEQ